ncbi:MAG: GNAT family N-acetyltransferase [Rhodoferax sp.]|nr:GNAT family N-acetyltransferase [Rhodoferax sp.]
MVPIRSLGANHRSRIAAHLKELNAHDRYFRFGYAANDQQIQRYVDGLNFDRDEIFGIYNRHLKLIAMAHLAYSDLDRSQAGAEFGVSVLQHVRGRGYGARLFERAVMHARNEGVRTMYVHVLSENTAMLRIARSAGAKVERDGAESEGHLLLPPATLDTRVTEMIEEQLANANYQIKLQAKFIRKTLNAMVHGWQPGDPDRRANKRVTIDK